jgi:hypothetical protein
MGQLVPRYGSETMEIVEMVLVGKVGRCRLNQVDP